MLDPKHFVSFRIGKLYFRYIKNTSLESQGWTAEKLAVELERAGFIQILTVQEQGTDGRYGPGERRYIELPGKTISRTELVARLKNVPIRAS